MWFSGASERGGADRVCTHAGWRWRVADCRGGDGGGGEGDDGDDVEQRGTVDALHRESDGLRKAPLQHA